MLDFGSYQGKRDLKMKPSLVPLITFIMKCTIRLCLETKIIGHELKHFKPVVEQITDHHSKFQSSKIYYRL